MHAHSGDGATGQAHPHRHHHHHHGEGGAGDGATDRPGTVHSGYVPDHDHEHDDEPIGPIEDNPIWQQDNVVLHSVGMDIGSSGTQVVFSRLHMRRVGEELTSRYVVVRRETVYRSPVALTPYAGAERIDAGALGTLVDRAYAAAGVDPDDVDTGVVILTGEALRRRNAEAIARVLAERGGEFVTATAGHHMEAMLAAYGSGAVRTSYEAGSRILTVDIGGGTTKLALLERGRIVRTAALHVGGRLLAHDAHRRLVRLEPAGSRHADAAGVELAHDGMLTRRQAALVAEAMADALFGALVPAGGPGEDAERSGAGWVWLTEPLGDLGPLDGVVFSGGVGEYVYDREPRDFGDLGRLLGRAVRRRVDAGALPAALLPAGECIRATALGASEYSVQLSGNTGCVTAPDRLLPRRNLQVVRPRIEVGERIDPDEVAAAIRRHLSDLTPAGTGAPDDTGTSDGARAPGAADADVVLALRWRGQPRYDRLIAFARGVRDGLAARTARGRPVYVVLDGDVAMTLGRLLRDELGVTADLLVIDGLTLRDFDYVDLGRLRHPSNTVPVTIKSLVFTTDPVPAEPGAGIGPGPAPHAAPA
ncbi:Reactivating factor of Adenosylcobalamin-dependent ethanolamine ammonia lyase [Actinacidiphila yanglinensis]|uniref:Reactivating factor of Adenosylcobalamin-dependent ethanolamine ammonia lyase n=1 Tax=Actinacidiphila yanglinensis TaxID=310779 RepID=A0A1H6DXS8_9ACTN|nr:ethanolamine ammonia-lyase reactivating factor EutA [Actinacidiphila yanglinensis]SEG89546.1 Reactivating factor of Adenosylcobalamin-dependent ethanolamine ammonia lyase [Actinacidiphila yanglinensis]